MPISLCKTIPSLPQQHNHHLSLPSSLPFSMKLNKKTNFTLSCSSYPSSDFSHPSDLRLIHVSCSTNSSSHLTSMDESEGLKFLYFLEEYEYHKAVYLLSRSAEFGIKFYDSIDEMSKLPEPNLNKLPVDLVNTMKQRMREVRIEADKNNKEDCPRMPLLGSYRKMLFCGFDDHHNQQQQQHKGAMKNSTKDDQMQHFSQKCSFSRVLIRTRLMQLFQGIGPNEFEGVDIPAVMADAYLFGAFCSLSRDEISAHLEEVRRPGKDLD